MKSSLRITLPINTQLVVPDILPTESSPPRGKPKRDAQPPTFFEGIAKWDLSSIINFVYRYLLTSSTAKDAFILNAPKTMGEVSTVPTFSSSRSKSKKGLESHFAINQPAISLPSTDDTIVPLSQADPISSMTGFDLPTQISQVRESQARDSQVLSLLFELITTQIIW